MINKFLCSNRFRNLPAGPFIKKPLLKMKLSTKTPVFTLFLRMLKQAFKYLTNMKRLPIVLLVFGAGTFLAFNSMGTGT